MLRLFLVIVMLGASVLCAHAEVTMKISSPDFNHNGLIPSRFTCQGEDLSPRLEITYVPEKAKSLVLIVDDPDAPMGTWDHWVVYNIPPETKVIEQGAVPGIQALNSYQKLPWGGPCPPSGTHRYFFTLYAVDKLLDLDGNARKTDVKVAMTGHILDKAELVGLYKKF
jgi:hypothetical protein